MKRVLVAIALGLFCLTNLTFAQKPITRLGILEPVGVGFNHLTSCLWELEVPGGTEPVIYGAAGDQPVAGNWVPNVTGIGVFRFPHTKYNQTNQARWLLSIQQFGDNPPDFDFYYGGVGDKPVVGDWTGSGTITIGVFRPPNTPYNKTSSDQWLLRNTNTPGKPDINFFYGAAGDLPVVGDWDGNGVATIGVYRPPGTPYNHSTQGQWLLRNKNTPGKPDIAFFYGAAGDIPVVGDWTGSGRTTIGVYRPAGTLYNRTKHGQWLLRNSNTPGNPDITINDTVSDYGSQPVVGTWVPVGP